VSLPPVKEYGPPIGLYWRYVWDTTGIPTIQEREGVTIYTPTFDKLVVYGREVSSPYAEDLPGLAELNARGRLMGEWFSVACPEGELGSWERAGCTQISETEFEAAYERGWE
jgi:hypothetical protein